MKKDRRKNRRNAIVKVEQPSKARAIALRVASLAAGACLGVGFEELARWVWSLLSWLF